MEFTDFEEILEIVDGEYELLSGSFVCIYADCETIDEHLIYSGTAVGIETWARKLNCFHLKEESGKDIWLPINYLLNPENQIIIEVLS